MGANDQEKIKIAREYFMRADLGRPDILELFHEDLKPWAGGISTLLTNLQDVFGENDPVRRSAIDEIFTDGCVLYEPRGVYRGRDEIDRIGYLHIVGTLFPSDLRTSNRRGRHVGLAQQHKVFAQLADHRR
jgi:hypothetical protein